MKSKAAMNIYLQIHSTLKSTLLTLMKTSFINIPVGTLDVLIGGLGPKLLLATVITKPKCRGWRACRASWWTASTSCRRRLGRVPCRWGSSRLKTGTLGMEWNLNLTIYCTQLMYLEIPTVKQGSSLSGETNQRPLGGLGDVRMLKTLLSEK